MKVTRKKIGLTLVLIVLLFVTALFILRAIYSPIILKTHTEFLFSQLDEAYRNSVTSSQHPVKTSKEFLERIPQWNIDWNSCQFREHIIYDSWGTPAEIHVDPSQVSLRSAGPDRLFDTSDDISRKIPN